MQTVSGKIAILTAYEAKAEEFFDNLLDKGYGILDAVVRTRDHFFCSTEFWEWLADENMNYILEYEAEV